jgi:FlaA1/EpsC-like NDP-sugar epimerase
LFEIEQELLRDQKIVPVSCVANCSDARKMKAIMQKYRPQIVLHAAAYKHVTLMEQNPFEAIECNVMGTHVTANAAGEAGAQIFILISTDKAVRPSSIMGASKNLAERVVSQLNAQFDTAYIIVRFGNVLGSSGSVVPIFKKQIALGGPLTVTDPHMRRYFMTIPEACQLVLQAACTGSGGELFILDMGKPVRILDLAEDMIRLSGFKPYEDIQIVFSGAKKGEKLSEELHADDEIAEQTSHPRIHLGRVMNLSEPISDLLAELNSLLQSQNEMALRNFLSHRIAGSQLQRHLPDTLLV